MKHYIIGVNGEGHVFEFKCSTISEAYDAVQDAATAFRIDIDMNRVMIDLVKMNDGELISSNWCGLRISIGDGEI